MFRIIQHRNKCIGCNACVEAARDRWRISRKDGKSVLVGGADKRGVFSVRVSEEEYAENMQAAKNCPVGIIQIIHLG
ncbi:MAG: ferredoxin [Chitinophagaceae bacterium]|nr:ferredoxin [Chitinophagaceae bacterium]